MGDLLEFPKFKLVEGSQNDAEKLLYHLDEIQKVIEVWIDMYDEDIPLWILNQKTMDLYFAIFTYFGDLLDDEEEECDECDDPDECEEEECEEEEEVEEIEGGK